MLMREPYEIYSCSECIVWVVTWLFFDYAVLLLLCNSSHHYFQAIASHRCVVTFHAILNKWIPFYVCKSKLFLSSFACLVLGVCVCVCRFFPSARRRWLHSLYDVQGPRCIQVSCDIPSKPNISKWNARIHQNVIRYDGVRIQQQRQATVTAARTTTARLPTRTVHITQLNNYTSNIIRWFVQNTHVTHHEWVFLCIRRICSETHIQATLERCSRGFCFFPAMFYACYLYTRCCHTLPSFMNKISTTCMKLFRYIRSPCLVDHFGTLMTNTPRFGSVLCAPLLFI